MQASEGQSNQDNPNHIRSRRTTTVHFEEGDNLINMGVDSDEEFSDGSEHGELQDSESEEEMLQDDDVVGPQEADEEDPASSAEGSIGEQNPDQPNASFEVAPRKKCKSNARKRKSMEAQLDNLMHTLGAMKEIMTQKGFFEENPDGKAKGKATERGKNSLAISSETTIYNKALQHVDEVPVDQPSANDPEIQFNYDKDKQGDNSSSDE